MATIPIPPISLPRRPVKKDVLRQPQATTVDIGAKADFFGALSKVGLGFYTALKEREAVDQLDRAQTDTLQVIAVDYPQWQRENPTTPDIELTQFNEMMNQARGKINKYLTNGQSIREYEDWFNKGMAIWSGRAMARTHAIDTDVKRSNMFMRADSLLDMPMTDLSEEEMRERQAEYEKTFIDGLSKGLYEADELPAIQRQISKGVERIEYNWWKAKLLTMPKEEYEVLIRDKSLPLDVAERKEIRGERDFWEKKADDDFKARQEETSRQLLVDIFEGTLTDPDIITKALADGLLSTTQAKSLRSYLVGKDELNLPNYVKVKDAIMDLREGRITRKQAVDVLYKNLDGIDKTTGKSLINEIYRAEEADDPLNNSTSKRILSAFGELETDGFYVGVDPTEMTQDEKARNLYLYMKYANDFEKQIKDYKTRTGNDMSPKQQGELFNSMIAPLKEERKRNFVWRLLNRIFQIWRAIPPPLGMGIPWTIKIKEPTIQEEPATQDEFEKAVGFIRDENEAEAYYLKWKHKWQ